MSNLAKEHSECVYDVLSLGEVMLRLDPGEGRIRTARQFRAWEWGGEYNVARGLRRCFGLRAALVTALVRDEVEFLLEDLLMQGGVDISFIHWRDSDGIGCEVRNGLNFTERGFGVRGAVGCSDRGNTAASQLCKGDVDWEHIFGRLGVRWFHTVTINDWGAIVWAGGQFYEATHRLQLEILDCVGCGDSFASDLIYGLMELHDPKLAVEYGAAHGALAMTTPGDATMASLAEVKKLVVGGTARVDRWNYNKL